MDTMVPPDPVSYTHLDVYKRQVLTRGTAPLSSDDGAGVGLDHLAFAVPDGESLVSWAEHLGEVGIDHDGVVLENGHPSLQLRDPDGIAVELVAP